MLISFWVNGGGFSQEVYVATWPIIKRPPLVVKIIVMFFFLIINFKILTSLRVWFYKSAISEILCQE